LTTQPNQPSRPITRRLYAIVALLIAAFAVVVPCGGSAAATSGLRAQPKAPAADAGIAPIRLNAGGGAYTGSDGRAWGADADYNGGNTFSTANGIAGAADPTLYQTERFGNFGYALPVPDGDYNVTLKFAEIYWTQPGQRVFNVDIEGRRVLDNFDILSAVGPNTALDKTFQAHVADGRLNIDFTSIVNNAKLSAVEVTQVGAANAVVQPSNGYVFGVLNAHQEHARQDYAAGVRAVEMVVGWDWYEQQDSVFSDVNTLGSYAYQMKQELQAFQAAGLKVILNLSLHYAPGWVFNYPNSHYVNQYGTQAPGWVNLTFNQILRQKAEEYIAHLNQDLGLNNFWAIRIGAGSAIETNLPYETSGGNNNGYWAYDANAQGANSNLPGTIPANPYPGWQPGDRSYNGSSFSTAQVGQWMDWYLGALMDGVNWQIKTFRNLGYTGYVHVLESGWGSRPSEYATAVGNYLDGTGDSLQTMGRGAVWDRDTAKISDRQNVVITISSMDDSSSHLDGSVAPDLCQAGDNSVDSNDLRILRWSAARWIAYNARRYGLPIIGENPGPADTTGTNPYGAQMMRDSASIMRSCDMQGMMWEFESNLYDGVSGVTINDYANVIAQYPH